MHVMLDLETMGTAPGSVIRSIGAVAFEFGGLVHTNTFYRNIDRDSCLDAGLTEDAKTMKWWQEQPADTQSIFDRDPELLPVALSQFYSWFKEVGGEEVWAQGAAFDPVLTEHAMLVCGILVPWKFWNVRDTRTLYAIADFAHHDFGRTGIEHYALDDCLHQIKCVNAAVKQLLRKAV